MTGSTYLLWTETFPDPLLKTFCYNDKGTRKVKVFEKLSKEFYNKLSKLIFHGQT